MNVPQSEDAPYPTAACSSMERIALDRITDLVRHTLRVPVSLITLVEHDRQVFRSHWGLPLPWSLRGETPLSHSFCQHCVVNDAPFVVEDAPNDPRICDNRAIPDLGVRAYLGVPLHREDGTPIGALCAIDTAPRAWSEHALHTVELLARNVETEFALHVRLAREQTLRRRSEALARARARFLQSMTHEVRNPLQGIFGGLALLRRQVRGEGLRLVGVIEQSARLLLEVNEEVLRQAREIDPPEAPPTEAARLAPAALLFRVAQAAAARARAFDVGVSVEAAPSLPALWPCPAAPVERALLGLLEHATGISRGGAMVLTGALEEGWLVFRVRAGDGADDEGEPRGFEAGPGGPLGPSIWQGLADRVGGRLGVETGPRGETTLRLALPPEGRPDGRPEGLLDADPAAWSDGDCTCHGHGARDTATPRSGT